METEKDPGQDKKKRNTTIRVLFVVLLALLGVILLLIESSGQIGTLVEKLGLSFLVAGVVAFFHEIIIKRFDGDSNNDKLSATIEKAFKNINEDKTSIILRSRVRLGMREYYYWTLSQHPQSLFFAGRSVLHRMEQDFTEKKFAKTEEIIVNHIEKGSSFHILFMDPRSNIIPTIEDQEKRNQNHMLQDLAISIAICKRIFSLIERKKPKNGRLEIRLSNDIPYYAYHSVKTKNTPEDQTIIGFYFFSSLGSQTGGYEVADLESKEFFSTHFLSVFERAEKIINFDPERNICDASSAIEGDIVPYLDKKLGREFLEKVEGFYDAR